MYESEQQTLEFIESLEARPGYALIAALDKRWFNQGQRAAGAGLPQAFLWNDVQQAGYHSWLKMHVELRRYRIRRMVRRAAVIAFASILIALAASGASAQGVVLPDPPSCTECWRTWLPIMHNTSVEGQDVDAATRMWGG